MSWRGVQRSQCSPKHNAFDSSGFLCLGDPPLPFLPQTNQGQAMETPSAKAHKQTTAQATIQEAPQADVSRKTRVRHVLEDSSGDGYRRPGTGGYRRPGELDVSPQKSHQRSQSTGCVLVRKAPTTPHSQATAPQAKDRWGLQGRPRWVSNDTRDRVLMSSPLGQAVR